MKGNRISAKKQVKVKFDPRSFMKEYIPVTMPSLPPLAEFEPYLKKIWASHWLTNNGNFHQELERKLCAYLGVKYISLFTNGTLALITALQALGIKGEVITTPYSFVATSHSLWWNNIKPVFVDIEPKFMNIDPEKIAAAITPKTSAILPVHVYGNPCATGRIKEIAAKHGLKVIYDACHAFGVAKKGKSILLAGDLSVLSFHATKIFNTFEGGAIVCHDEKMKRRIDLLKNFGFAGELEVIEPGINAKMNEFQAALGLLQLKYVDRNIAKSKKIAALYRKHLAGIPGLSMLQELADTRYNYSYFPIFIDKKTFGKSRDEVYSRLKENGIYARRYFYPLISDFSPYKSLKSARPQNLPIAKLISEQVLCLPIYPELQYNICRKIISEIKQCQFKIEKSNNLFL
jgi:dTDP-4-amino-4,6-dideoxygalactose transaminase